MKKPILKLVAILSFTAATAMTAQAAIPFFSSDKDETPTLAPMLEETSPAVVSIAVKGVQVSRQRIPEMFRYFYGPNAPEEKVQERPFSGLGSGVIIDAENGYVVTNNHVVDNANEITVKLTDGREFSATKLGSDAESDIALLQIEADKLIDIPLADSDSLRVGDFVIAIGNPFGLGQTVTSGIVSALGRSGLNIEGFEDFIQTDAAINRGNSGGALVNLKGQLVGINTAIIGPGNIGIGFAIPANMMKSLVDQIIEFGEVRRGLLGILGGDLTSDLAEAMGVEHNQGVIINQVTPDSAAETAGLQAGDVIIAIDGKVIKRFHELRAKIATSGAGSQIELTILRDGKTQEVEVTLGAHDDAQIAATELHPALEGVVFANGETEKGQAGVVVTEIDSSSPAARMGLKKDDVILGVNRQRVTKLSEMKEQLDNKANVFTLNIKRGNLSVFLVFR